MTDGPAHVPGVAIERPAAPDGRWFVYCVGCSEIAGDWVVECRLLDQPGGPSRELWPQTRTLREH